MINSKLSSKLMRFSAFVLLLAPQVLKAQDNSIQMADKLHESGLIWIVVGVMLIFLFGLLAYLYNLDRKISKLENRN